MNGSPQQNNNNYRPQNSHKQFQRQAQPRQLPKSPPHSPKNQNQKPAPKGFGGFVIPKSV